MASVTLFMRQIAHMAPRHLAPNKRIDKSSKLYVIYIYEIIS